MKSDRGFGGGVVELAHIEMSAHRFERRALARSAHALRPPIRRVARPHLDRLLPMAHENVLLQRWHALVVLELVTAVVLFGAATEHLDDDARIRDPVLVVRIELARAALPA